MTVRAADGITTDPLEVVVGDDSLGTEAVPGTGSGAGVLPPVVAGAGWGEGSDAAPPLAAAGEAATSATTRRSPATDSSRARASIEATEGPASRIREPPRRRGRAATTCIWGFPIAGRARYASAYARSTVAVVPT